MWTREWEKLLFTEIEVGAQGETSEDWCAPASDEKNTKIRNPKHNQKRVK